MSKKFPYEFISHVLITPQQIRERVEVLGKQITDDYKDSEHLLILGLLRGSVMFITDLMREVKLDMDMDFMAVSSYAGSESSGFVHIDMDHKTNIRGWDVILVDDIVDSGYTVSCVRKLLLDRQPKSLRTCALLDKKERHKVEVPIDYLGFDIPDHFVIGYGLDYNEKGRNLPYIAVVDFKKLQQG